jgi:peptidoglycan hydrolase-like protein with peptidoglycan-binding domain
MPGDGPSRDLAVMVHWEASYARSRERRQRAARSMIRRGRFGGVAAPPPSLSELLSATRERERALARLSAATSPHTLMRAGGRAQAARDLSDSEPWHLSLGRSRARRRAQQLRFAPASTRAKRLSLGALAALTAAPIAALTQASAPTIGEAAAAGPPTTTDHTVPILLGPGSEGRQVRLLQQALNVKIDGVFGPETELAVRRLQAIRGLTIDGVVGPKTGAALRMQTAATATFASFRDPVPAETASTGGAVASDPATVAARAAAYLTSATSPSAEEGAEGETAGSEAAVPVQPGVSTEAAGGTSPTAGEEGGTGVAGPDTGSTAVVGESAATSTEAAAPSEAATLTEDATPAGSSRWQAVTRLQAALHLPTDGDFGPETEAAVKRLQARHGLATDGVVGPATWSVIGVTGEQTLTPPPSALIKPRSASNHAASNVERPSAGAGSRWDALTRLQAALHLPTDGQFGPETEAAVKRLQVRHGLTPDGVVGPATWSVIGVTGERTLTPPASARTATPATGDSEGTGSAVTSAGGGEGVVARVIAAANEIATRPYVYGGGHGSFQSYGYDCSGSVSYALHGGGLLSSPEDSTQLESYGEPGPGRYITIYANSEHAYMTIDGRRFDTVALAEGGSRWSSSSGYDGGGFVVRHPPGL